MRAGEVRMLAENPVLSGVEGEDKRKKQTLIYFERCYKSFENSGWLTR